MEEYLLDKEFLKQLDYQKQKEVYVKLIALNNNELPREEIIGKTSSGSVNVDGSSAVRRTCSLSMVALDSDVIITDAYWCYNNKFKLEIGLRNQINPTYPDIIWFKMGLYIITNFSTSKSNNSLTVSISGKDKMCRLNGDVSGNLMHGTDFGCVDTTTINPDTGEYQTQRTKLPIKEIIFNAVKTFGQELDYNIRINDLDDYGYDLWEYRGDTPMYMFMNSSKEVMNITFDSDTLVSISGIESKDTKISEIPKYYSLNTLDPNYNNDATKIYEYSTGINPTTTVIKIEFGQTAGYHQTPLVYNNDLILGAGETVTALLDKLKTMLGEFEYFYDLDGHFVFQKKKNYIQELFSPVNGDIITPTMYVSKYSYDFADEALFTQISNQPNIGNMKNDFAIWGSRKSVMGEDLPIHARYAIDKKPQSYTSPYIRLDDKLVFLKIESVVINGNTEEEKQEDFNNKSIEYDGLYQLNISEEETKLILVSKYSPDINHYYKKIKSTSKETSSYELFKINRKNNSYTYIEANVNNEYEGFYVKSNNEFIIATTSSILPFYIYNMQYITDDWDCWDWRELIYQMALDYYAHNQDADFLLKIKEANPQFPTGLTGYEQYYTDLERFWRQLYNPLLTQADIDFAIINDCEYETNHWNKLIHIDPTRLNFWFDFLDTEGELNAYSVKKYDKVNNKYISNVGTRSKVVNESTIKSIYNIETPEVIFKLPGEEIDADFLGTIIQIQDSMSNLFYRSGQGVSAIERANELINTHTASVGTLSISAIPIYYLEPNTRVNIIGYGDYILDKISYQLAYNGTMSISCNKVIKQFY